MQAIDKELTAMTERGVLDTVPWPEGLETDKIGTLSLLLTKKRDGRFKARLVFNGRKQKYKITSYYGSPTLSRDALWFSLSLASHLGYSFRSMDITSAFLYASLPEEVSLYSKIPEGHPEFAKTQTHLLRIRKNIYGLKEAPRIWWDHLTGILIKALKMTQSIHEECLFYDKGVLLLVYVDDLWIFSSKERLKQIHYIFRKEVQAHFDTNRSTS